MQENKMMYEISIPNEELKIIYSDTILLWFEQSIGSKNLNEMLKALLSGDIDLFEEILSSFAISYLSFFHTSQDHIEKVYHAFVLGMLINLQENYHIESERESGYGRVDIIMTPHDKRQRAFIIEMKKIRISENKDSALDVALRQIEDRKYETLLRQQGCQHIMKLAVTFDGKRVWVKRG
ncbi:MAG: PD-(D/E)XK nuclease domain-containing protein [Bacteroidales bacterium]